MKVGIMQPYVFPYIGYFQLINYVDKWVVFDDTQYISKGWVNRNRILHPDMEKEWQYFSVPLRKHSHDCRIKDIEINEDIDWKSQLLGKLTSYKKKAPFYMQTIEFVNECVSVECPMLSEWVVFTLKRTCEYLNIPFDYSIFSKMEINNLNIEHAGQWALEIADATGADEYTNPPAGHGIFKEHEFRERGIELNFLKPRMEPYVQIRGEFIAGLSIIDVMMWNDKKAINKMLSEYDIVTQSQLK